MREGVNVIVTTVKQWLGGEANLNEIPSPTIACPYCAGRGADFNMSLSGNWFCRVCRKLFVASGSGDHSVVEINKGDAATHRLESVRG